MTSQCSSLISVAVKNTRAKASRRGKGSLGPDLQLTVHHWGKPEQELSQDRYIKASLRLYQCLRPGNSLTAREAQQSLGGFSLLDLRLHPRWEESSYINHPQIDPQANQLLGNSSNEAALRQLQVVSSWQVNADHQDGVSGQQEPFPGHRNSGPHSVNSPACNKGPITAALKCRMSAGLNREELPKPQFSS